MALRRVLIPVALSALAAVMTTGPAQAGTHEPHVKAQHAAKPTASSQLVDHGGKLLSSSTTYAIWWGSSGFPTDEQTAIPTLLQGFGGSSYLATANQYMRGGTATSTYVHEYADTSAPPSHGPSVNTIVNEVASVLATNHVTADPNAIYFVYTSNFPKVNYCAWHSAGTIGGVTVQVAYVPNTTGVTGCAPAGGYSTATNGFTPGTQSIADSTAHEFMEAVTDPVPTSGWADKSGAEIADKCQTFYSGLVKLGKTNWQLQGEWSNAVAGCVETTP
jgi:hypothetical protein